jgi:hypothetical protein
MLGNRYLFIEWVAMLCLGLNASSLASTVSPDVSYEIADETGA